ENLSRIGKLWEPIVGAPMSPEKVALCLVQLKVSRLVHSPGHWDSWVDGAGYFGLGGEAAEKSAQEPPVTVNELTPAETDYAWENVNGCRYEWIGDCWHILARGRWFEALESCAADGPYRRLS